MRRGVEAALYFGRTTDRIQHRCSGAFAVCSCDLNGRERAFGIAESSKKEFGIAETQLNRQSLMTKTQEIFNGRLEMHKISRAKAQRRKGRRKEDVNSLCVFLCVFAPLRESSSGINPRCCPSRTFNVGLAVD